MIMKLYAIYDIKAQLYHHPRCFINTPHAMRSVAMESQQGNSIITQYPDDFQLLELGEWDDNYATIDLLQKPKLISSIGEILRADKNDQAEGRNDENHHHDSRERDTASST